VDPQGPMFEFRSNVFYNWGEGRAGYNADTESLSTYAFIGNAYLTGPNSTGAMAFEEDNPLARAWFEGNAMNSIVPADPWSLVKDSDRPGYRLQARPDWASAAAGTPAQTVAAVLAAVGASKARDSVDQRVIAGVSDRSGRIIDSQAGVGGWPELSPGTAWVDTDGDGMPDDWETARGLDPADPADGATDGDADGYTHLEDWLNSLA